LLINTKKYAVQYCPPKTCEISDEMREMFESIFVGASLAEFCGVKKGEIWVHYES